MVSKGYTSSTCLYIRNYPKLLEPAQIDLLTTIVRYLLDFRQNKARELIEILRNPIGFDVKNFQQT